MQRRDVLKLLSSAVTLSALPTELVAALREARAESGNSTDCLRTLDAHQNVTVTTICELIIPETDTPGAKGAKVNEFIDLLLTEWFNQGESAQFLAGLKQIDEESKQKFGANFVECNATQQRQLMKQFDDGAMEYVRARKAAKASGSAPPENFFYSFKRLTLLGYYTSEDGFKKELGKTIIPPSHAGCAPVKAVRP